MTEELTQQQRSFIEEELIEVLSGWKINTDKLAVDTAAARAAVARAKELEIWEGKYGSFKEWLSAECGITEQWGYSLIRAAKTITAIEEVAESSKRLKELTKPVNRKKLQALPDRAVKTLQSLPPAKAGAVMLSAIKECGEAIPDAQTIQRLVQETKPPLVLRNLKPMTEHPAVIAVDNAWTEIQRGLAYSNMSPSDMYRKYKLAVQQAVAK